MVVGTVVVGDCDTVGSLFDRGWGGAPRAYESTVIRVDDLWVIISG
ncbi:hypothetical protein GCM10011610_50780 [Nocardia rhizosphaerihabitans]|uniref:Uncharacterized protein n=1 Tax=Nocardia rhizosphaerihabitans TaxID=1691570 RepID=A0ABQ2KRL3_9NOCA|nr:hypothetical protein GCM10011610_50780 [Nocardia rhizosphaerihabitans]